MPQNSSFWKFYETCKNNNFAKCNFCFKRIKTLENTTNEKPFRCYAQTNVAKAKSEREKERLFF